MVAPRPATGRRERRRDHLPPAGARYGYPIRRASWQSFLRARRCRAAHVDACRAASVSTIRCQLRPECSSQESGHRSRSPKSSLTAAPGGRSTSPASRRPFPRGGPVWRAFARRSSVARVVGSDSLDSSSDAPPSLGRSPSAMRERPDSVEDPETPLESVECESPRTPRRSMRTCPWTAEDSERAAEAPTIEIVPALAAVFGVPEPGVGSGGRHVITTPAGARRITSRSGSWQPELTRADDQE
jgi:hypothetical protein